MIEVLERLRWKAVAIYRQRDQPDLVRSWMFDEIADLHDAIERGPNYGALKSVTITYQLGEDQYHLGDDPGDMDSPYASAEVLEFPR
jgi:hypothetical protein